MAASLVTPNMSLVVPTVGKESGPQWATDINSSLTIIDTHNHSSGSGVQITPSGININSDLTFGNYAATNVGSVQLYSNVSPLAINGALYRSSADLYFTDGAGNQIRITQSGSVSGSAGTITGLPSGTASAAFTSGNGSFVFQQSTSTGANLDVASVAIRYPGSYPTPSGNYIQLQAPTSLASGYAITLPALPGSTSALNITTSGIMGSITYDGIGSGMTSTGANAVAATRTRSTGTTVGAGGVAISSSCSNFSTSGSTPTAVTNLSVTITTSGRPVQICIIPDGTQSGSTNEFIWVSFTTATSFVRLRRGGSTIGEYPLQGSSGATIPPSSVTLIDPVSAGTYTYDVYLYATSGSTFLQYGKLVAYEL